jgi:hypothetical protein
MRKQMTLIIVALLFVAGLQAQSPWQIGNPNLADVVATLSGDANGDTLLTITGSGKMKSWSNTNNVPWNLSRTNIKYLDIGENITNIGAFAFENFRINSAVIPHSVTDIERNAFYGCVDMTSVNILSGVIFIGNYAFGSCRSLASINVDEENQKFSSENGILYNKQKDTLLSCPAGKTGTVIIPNSVEVINTSAFSNCIYINSLIMGNSVRIIKESGFLGCSNLSGTLSFGTAIERIENYAFSSSPLITSIVCQAPAPPVIFQNSFRVTENTSFSVPCENQSAYLSAPIWENFNYGDCVSAIFDVEENEALVRVFPNPATNILNISTKSSFYQNETIEIYNINGILLDKYNAAGQNIQIDISNYSSGVYFVKAGKVRTKVIKM